MRFADRVLVTAIVSILFVPSVFGIDVGGETAVIIDYPGGTASLAAREFGQPLHEETKYTFLLDLLSYLENSAGYSNHRYEIEITGALPSTGHNEIIDFYLVDGKNNTHGVLYRFGS